MTGPASGAYDHRILKHPEYKRAYYHYLYQGAPPEEAARLGYEWTQQHLANTHALAPRPAKSTNHVAIGVLAAFLATSGVLLGAAVASNTQGDTVSVKETSTAAPAPATTSPSPSPSVTTEAPANLPPITIAPAPPTAAPVPTVKKPPPVRTSRPPVPTKAVPAPAACHPAYPDECLRTGIGDYDCAGGSGNGPNYVTGPVRVLPPDPFGLDANHDGTGCEQG